MSTVGAEARELLLSSQEGILSTHSVDCPGYPFGSVVSFSFDTAGRPVILISALAQHTKNLQADPRASLIVLAAGEDIQAAARLTLLGDFAPVPAAEAEVVAERYCDRIPTMRDFHRIYDFSFWRLTVHRARFVGGFGRIHWLSPEELGLREAGEE